MKNPNGSCGTRVLNSQLLAGRREERDDQVEAGK